MSFAHEIAKNNEIRLGRLVDVAMGTKFFIAVGVLPVEL